jgi:hypothetical protein
MPNKYHSSDVTPSKQSGGEGGGGKAMGSGGPKGEGKTGPNRSGGDPTTGKRGPFYVRKSGL